eukprot:2129440-Amphidinium_carterae.1
MLDEVVRASASVVEGGILRRVAVDSAGGGDQQPTLPLRIPPPTCNCHALPQQRPNEPTPTERYTLTGFRLRILLSKQFCVPNFLASFQGG